VYFVQPDNTQYLVDIKLTQQQIGIVRVGQDVQIRVDAHSYLEYGYLNGSVNYVSDVFADSGFRATVVLKNNLITNLNRKLDYQFGLTADAVIYVESEAFWKRMLRTIIPSSEN
jgi:HlyD family secretion protein